jgi:hypothetical protein
VLGWTHPRDLEQAARLYAQVARVVSSSGLAEREALLSWFRGDCGHARAEQATKVGMAEIALWTPLETKVWMRVRLLHLLSMKGRYSHVLRPGRWFVVLHRAPPGLAHSLHLAAPCGLRPQ